MVERLQKVLAHAGVASRRKAEELIVSGRVTVDGEVTTELGTKVDPRKHQIAVDGRPIQLESPVNIVLYKPTSYVTTVADPQGRRTVMELVKDIPERVYPVGRLDYDTSGLLLLSNDGELTQRLLHPKHRIDKRYRVTVVGMPERADLDRLRTGLELEDGRTAPAEVTVLRNHPQESVLELVIHEGRNRQIRRMFEHLGLPVKRLKRIAFGPLSLQGLTPGEWRWLTADEWTSLYRAAGLEPPVYPLARMRTGRVRPDQPRRGAERRNQRRLSRKQKS